jgi:hypothetical protein
MQLANDRKTTAAAAEKQPSNKKDAANHAKREDGGGGGGSVVVAVRVRPFSTRETALRASRVVEMVDQRITQLWLVVSLQFLKEESVVSGQNLQILGRFYLRIYFFLPNKFIIKRENVYIFSFCTEFI